MAGSYDFEEQERLAELKGWWEDNRWYVVAAIAAAVLAFAGYRGWQYWSASQAEDAAAMYVAVSKAQKEQRVAAVDALVAKHPGSYYASEGQLVVARDKFDAADLPGAEKRLEWVMERGVEEHRGIARLRLTALVADLRGDVMLAQGRIDEARAAYKLASEKADARNPVKGIAETKLNALG